ncbi:MAG: biliverdin-producing heme oxygenase [Pseudomonadota bacterium]
MKADARHHLKAKTNDLHEQLHALPAFVSLLDNTLDVPGYVSIMTRFRDFYAQLDVEMQQACDDHDIPTQLYHYEPRAPMFAADVLALAGNNYPAVRADTRLPVVNCVASLAGVAYVIDGSVLGGISMNKSAAALLGGDAIEGRSYWNWCRMHGVRQ